MMGSPIPGTSNIMQALLMGGMAGPGGNAMPGTMPPGMEGMNPFTLMALMGGLSPGGMQGAQGQVPAMGGGMTAQPDWMKMLMGAVGPGSPYANMGVGQILAGMA